MKDSNILLEEIADKIGCTFLSDLHLTCKLPAISQAIETIPYDRYSLQGWQDAAFYISGQKCAFDNEVKIRAFLSDYCKEQSDV